MNTLSPESLASAVDSTISGLAAESKFEAGKDHAAQAVRDITDAAVLKAREVKGSTVQKALDVRHRVENSVQDARYAAERRTRENPMGSLLCAFGAGFVLGLILRR